MAFAEKSETRRGQLTKKCTIKETATKSMMLLLIMWNINVLRLSILEVSTCHMTRVEYHVLKANFLIGDNNTILS